MNTLLIQPVKCGSATGSDSQRGISLIETMIGMTIGILMVLIIIQAWGTFENQKQTTVSGSTTQANGLLTMTELEQDIRSAGAGLTNAAAFNCTTTYSYYETGATSVTPIPAYAGGMSMVPVQITDGGTDSDTLTVKLGADFLGALPATLTNSMPQSSSELNLSSVAGFSDGDVVLAVGASGKCTVMMVTQVQGAALKLQHNPGGSTTYNPTTADQTSLGWPAFVSGDKIMKVGQMIAHQYTVNASNQLVLTDLTVPSASTTSILATDIVKIKAQYGIANVSSQDVTNWINATASTGWNTLDSAKVKRIKAVRLAIVARSAKREGSDVTGVCTNASGGVNNGPCAWPDSVAVPAPLIDLSANADWKKYRYRVYQTIIPMRNVIWAGV